MATSNICKNCGKVINTGDVVCLHCGSAVNPSPLKAEAPRWGNSLIAVGSLIMVAGITLLLLATVGWNLISSKIGNRQDEALIELDAAGKEGMAVSMTDNGASDVATVSPKTEQSGAGNEEIATAPSSTASEPVFGVNLFDSATPEPLPLSSLSGLGYIVYVHYPGGGTTEIHRINADGSERSFVALGQSPGVSNDGAWIAYEDLQDAPDIFVSSSRGDMVRQISTDPAADFNPIWSPDGQEIFFQSERGDEFNYVVSVETREVRAEYPDWVSLTATTGPYQGWTAETCRIEQTDGSSRLSVCLSKGIEEIDIIGQLAPYELLLSTDPWSPDGQFLVLGDNFRLFIFEIATGRYVELPTEGRARDAHWAPSP